MGRVIGWTIGVVVALALAYTYHPHVVVCFFLGFGLSGYGMKMGEGFERYL